MFLFKTPNYVVSKLGFYDWRNLSFLKVEGGFFELLHHLSPTKRSEVSAALFGGTKRQLFGYG